MRETCELIADSLWPYLGDNNPKLKQNSQNCYLALYFSGLVAQPPLLNTLLKEQ